MSGDTRDVFLKLCAAARAPQPTDLTSIESIVRNVLLALADEARESGSVEHGQLCALAFCSGEQEYDPAMCAWALAELMRLHEVKP
jgi:hypothetical protein